MPAGYAAVAAAVIGYAGSQQSAGAAKDAAGMQQAAAQDAIGFQKQQFAQTSGNLSPFLNSGIAANTLRDTLLGISNDSQVSTAQGMGPEYQSVVQPIYKQFGVTGPGQSYAADDAAVKYYMEQRNQKSKSDPQYGSLLKQFDGKDLENTPGYQFQLGQGNQAITNAAAAGRLPGGPQSGAALQEAIKFNQGLAGTRFDTAFAQDQQQKQFTLGSLTGVAGAGQNAAVQQGGFGQNAAAGIAGNTIGAGNAQAAGIVGGANATSQGINNAIGTYQNAQTLRSVFGNNNNGGYSSPDAFTTGQVGGADGMGGLG